MSDSAYSEIRAAADIAIEGLAGQSRRPWQVELRHGPFKPCPERRVGQLHVIADDENSLALLPWAVRAHRAATGYQLLGQPLLELGPKGYSQSEHLHESRLELTRWRDAIAAREIPFRHWLFDPHPRLVEARVTAATAWDLRCLLKGASNSSDLHQFTVMLTGGRVSDIAESLARPPRSQLWLEGCAWQTLATCWGQVRDRALATIEAQLTSLPQK